MGHWIIFLWRVFLGTIHHYFHNKSTYIISERGEDMISEDGQQIIK